MLLSSPVGAFSGKHRRKEAFKTDELRSDVPLNVCIKRRHWMVLSLISLYKEVLVHLPDGPVFVPALQISLKVAGIG